MLQPTRVFIVVGVRLFREGLAEILGRTESFTIAGVHPVGFEVLAHIAELHPEVVLLDMVTPQSLAIARELHLNFPDTSIVALGVSDSEADTLACAEVGITGFLTPEIAIEDLVKVVKSAAHGEMICSPHLASRLVRRLAALAGDRRPDPPSARLTAREREIVALLERDLSNKEIATSLGIEVATVKNHVHNLLEKLSVHRRSDAVRLLGHARQGVGIGVDSARRAYSPRAS